MEGKKSKIPISIDTTLGFAYLNSVNHHSLFLKSALLKKELGKLQKKKLKSNLAKIGNNQMQELLRIEIITNTVHYAETFASLLLAMRKYRRFHKFLLEYKIDEIIDFYTNLPKKKPQYVAKILQYPYPNKFVDNRFHPDLQKTIKQASDELKRLAKFYLELRQFYNSYKHGFRLLTTYPDDTGDDIMTFYFSDKGQLRTMRIVNTRDHVDEALDLCSFIFRFLDNAENIFRQRKLEKKNEFSMTLLSKKSS